MPDWWMLMQEDMQQFINHKYGKTLSLPLLATCNRTKMIFKNKRDAKMNSLRNKARLVAVQDTTRAGIDYMRYLHQWPEIEAIRLFFGFCIVYGHSGFEDPYFPSMYNRVVKAPNGLHQAPRACMSKIVCFSVYNTITKRSIQLKQLPADGIFISQYRDDSDYAGSHGDQKSTTSGCQFLGRRLISWQCKKQTIVATSTTESRVCCSASFLVHEGVSGFRTSCLDYGFNFMNTKIFLEQPEHHMQCEETLRIHTNEMWRLLTRHLMDQDLSIWVVNTAARCTFFLLTGLVLSALVLDDLEFSCWSYYDSAGSYPFCWTIGFCWSYHISAGGSISADRVCAQFDIAGWLVSATSHLVSAGSLHSCWCNNVSAA
ncbi:hypothetical protein Tco_0002678 [Tanacetum coccineum]